MGGYSRAQNQYMDEVKRGESKVSSAYQNVESPTRKLIAQYEDRIHEFDINRVLEWNSENIRKYKIAIEKQENADVMLNIMLLDKQI